MQKKAALILFAIIVLLTLSACPDKEKQGEHDNTEKIPNTMHKASDELEQIITLLGGPLFSGRDNIEQMKNEQMQKLLETIQKYTVATQDKQLVQPGGGTEKSKQQEQGGKSGKQEEENTQGQQESMKESKGGQEEQDKQKDSENDGDSDKEKESMKDESKQDKKEEGEDENSGDQPDLQKPGTEQDKAFQFDESLFGIPQWHDENWKMIKVLTDGMHFTWNNLQPELIKKGVSQNQIENFNKALIALSQNVNAKNITESQNAAFQLSQALADFYSYYKSNIPPELPRISSGVAGIHFAVKQNNWTKAQELANLLQQEFAKLKASTEDNQNHVFQMLELSINDLCNAVYNQDSVLVIIRTSLVNSNIRELDVKLSQTEE